MRRFPLHCVADREYLIARRAFSRKDSSGGEGYGAPCLYGITKGMQVRAFRYPQPNSPVPKPVKVHYLRLPPPPPLTHSVPPVAPLLGVPGEGPFHVVDVAMPPRPGPLGRGRPGGHRDNAAALRGPQGACGSFGRAMRGDSRRVHACMHGARALSS